MLSNSAMRRAVIAAGGVYHASRYGDYSRPGEHGPAGRVDHLAPGWTLPGSPSRLTLGDAYAAISQENQE